MAMPRKLKNFNTIGADDNRPVKALNFDYSGGFLAVARGASPRCACAVRAGCAACRAPT